MVEAWSYAGPYTIEANGTTGTPVTPPPPSRVGGSRVCEFLRRDTSRLREKAHQLRWRPRPHAQRTGSTPRLRPSGAASHLDLFAQPAGLTRSGQARASAQPVAR